MASDLAAQHGDADLVAKQLQPAAGLKVETYASDPLFFNPVAFTVDEKGRLFVAETHRYKDSIFDLWKMNDRWKMADFSFRTVEDREKFLAKEFATNIAFLTKDSEIIRLVEDKDGNGRPETSSVFASGFNKTTSGTAAGVLARRNELWFTCIPDLWKFKYDSNGKKTAQELLHTGYGVHISVSGHDFHGLVLGPDGKLYFSVGDRGANVKSKEGKQLELLQQGGVFRCNPDGSDLEIYATGLRNPQELAFDQFGNLWTHDNDTSGEDKARVIHVVEGADYGWRQSYQFMENFGPWVKDKIWEGNIDDVLPPAGYGAQGPSGLALYPGVGLPDKYKGALIGCDFPQGVWAYFPKNRGASYEITKEKFLWGFGATDVAFGPEGNTYISDWGKSYNLPNAGKIYRVFDPANNAAQGAEVKKLFADGFEKRTQPELTALLAHADLRIRTEAQFELEKRGVEGVGTFLATAKPGQNQFARIHALHGLAAGARNVSSTNTLYGRNRAEKDKVLADIIAATGALLADPDAEIRAQAARLAGEVKLPSTTALTKCLGDENLRVRFHAAMSLGKLKKTEAVPALFTMLKENDGKDAFLRHAGVWALANIGDTNAIIEAGKNPDNSVAVRHAAMLTLRRLKSPEITLFLTDQDHKIAVETARAIHDVPIPGAMTQLAQGIEECKCGYPEEMKLPFFQRQINANLRLGQGPNLYQLLSYVGRHNVPEECRAAGLDALVEWDNPGPLDWVIGLWRPVPAGKRAKLSHEVVGTLLTTFLDTEKDIMKLASLRCGRRLGIKEVAPAALKLFENPKASPGLRLEALNTLGELKTKELAKAVPTALASEDSALRAMAVQLAAQLNPTDAIPLLEKLLATEKDIKLGQAIYASLGDLKGAPAEGLLLKQLNEFMTGKVKAELQLDLLEAAEKHSASPQIKEALQKYQSSLSQSDPLGPFRVCLSGGDVEAGKKVFRENDAVGCLRCHAIKGKGGTVGPDLAGVASRNSADKLLESILFPNKEISAGYENVTIVMKGGTSYAGMVKAETDTELMLHSPEDGDLTLKKSDIEKRDRTLSAMPEGLTDLLTKRDLRNLAAYIGTLK